MKADEYKILAFKDAAAWRKWLSTHYANTDGVWARFYKKNSGVATVTYAEALDDALCYGWIDGQVKRYDKLSYLQKFTPRRARSMWSKQNIDHIARLTAAGLMTPAGQAEVDRAKADGRWQEAYDSPKNMVVPADFIAAVNRNKKTAEFFVTLSKSNLYTIGYQLQTAKKPETRARRSALLLAKLEKGERPQQ